MPGEPKPPSIDNPVPAGSYRRRPSVVTRSGSASSFRAREIDSEAALSSDARPGGPRLLSVYDRLRARIVKGVEKRKLGRTATDALLLVPDLFVLLARLSLDPEVPSATRGLMAGALAYFLLPADLLPEALLGVGGFLDDVVLAAAVVAHAFGDEVEDYAAKHWSGPQELRSVIRDLSQSAHALLGVNLYGRLKRLLSRRGIEIEGPEAGTDL